MFITMDTDTLKKFAIGIIGGMLLLIAMLSVDFLLDKNIYCPRFAKSIDRPYQYDYFGGGCFVQDIDGRWVYDNYWNSPQ